MERGYRLGSLITELVAESPDLVFLQEVDCSCDRSFRNDVAGELAIALGDFHVAFATEKDMVNGGGSSSAAPADLSPPPPSAPSALAAEADAESGAESFSSRYSIMSDRGTLVGAADVGANAVANPGDELEDIEGSNNSIGEEAALGTGSGLESSKEGASSSCSSPAPRATSPHQGM